MLRDKKFTYEKAHNLLKEGKLREIIVSKNKQIQDALIKKLVPVYK